MRSSGVARYGFTLLVVLQLSASLGGVALLSRMRPAVEQILEENVYSTEAVEEMLDVLSRRAGTDAFQAALERARGNITEPEEVRILDGIEVRYGDALDGDEAAIGQVSALLRDLGEVNRASMRRADERAQVLGLAGAWGMAMLGFVGFLASLSVYRRMETDLFDTVREIEGVLEAAREGDSYRRCVPMGASERLASNVNWLLDRSAQSRDGGDVVHETALRDALLWMLDQEEERVMVVGTASGEVVATNRMGLEGGEELPGLQALGRGVVEGVIPEGWEVTTFPSGAWCARSPA